MIYRRTPLERKGERSKVWRRRDFGFGFGFWGEESKVRERERKGCEV
jgi:hypothetical protein